MFGIFVSKCYFILDFSSFEQVSFYHLFLAACSLGHSRKTPWFPARPKWLFKHKDRFLPALGSKMKNWKKNLVFCPRNKPGISTHTWVAQCLFGLGKCNWRSYHTRPFPYPSQHPCGLYHRKFSQVTSSCLSLCLWSLGWYGKKLTEKLCLYADEVNGVFWGGANCKKIEVGY